MNADKRRSIGEICVVSVHLSRSTGVCNPRLGADGYDFDEQRLAKLQMPGLQTPAEHPGERLLCVNRRLSAVQIGRYTHRMLLGNSSNQYRNEIVIAQAYLKNGQMAILKCVVTSEAKQSSAHNGEIARTLSVRRRSAPRNDRLNRYQLTRKAYGHFPSRQIGFS
jgi:hypothetical protein